MFHSQSAVSPCNICRMCPLSSCSPLNTGRCWCRLWLSIIITRNIESLDNALYLGLSREHNAYLLKCIHIQWNYWKFRAIRPTGMIRLEPTTSCLPDLREEPLDHLWANFRKMAATILNRASSYSKAAMRYAVRLFTAPSSTKLGNSNILSIKTVRLTGKCQLRICSVRSILYSLMVYR